MNPGIRSGALVAALLSLSSMFGAQEPAEVPTPVVEPAQEQGTEQAAPPVGVRAVELRVVESLPGDLVTVDRGSSDGLALGDLVLLYAPSGETHGGVVTELRARTADVRLDTSGAAPTPGTRGKVYVPRARGSVRTTRPAPAPDAEVPPWIEPEAPIWTPDMPLLAGIDAVHPSDRSVRYGGRMLWTLDGIVTDTDRTDLYSRAGADVWIDNPFGRGGRLSVDVEGNFRSTAEPDGESENRMRLRTDRLSYSWGGNRFDSEHVEIGRFLQSGMPEFGVLDGAEYALRLENGDSFGASVGYMPEPTLDHDTGADFQFAGWYHWVLDDSERMALETGIQKTLHDGDSDRDLLVTRFRFLPPEGWRANATVWIDRYGASDPARGAGIGLTQAIVSLSRNEGLEHGVSWTLTHRELPDLDRNEYPPTLFEELKNDRLDRVTFDTWRRLSRGRRVHGRVSGWLDENDEGGNADVGMEWRDVLRDGLRTDLTLFAGQGAYGFDLGADLSCFWETGHGRWEAGYDITRREQTDFDPDRNTLFLHRTYLRHHWAYGSGWNLSTYLEGRLAEEELSASGGLTLQRTF